MHYAIHEFFVEPQKYIFTFNFFKKTAKGALSIYVERLPLLHDPPTPSYLGSLQAHIVRELHAIMSKHSGSYLPRVLLVGYFEQ